MMCALRLDKLRSSGLIALALSSSIICHIERLFDLQAIFAPFADTAVRPIWDS